MRRTIIALAIALVYTAAPLFGSAQTGVPAPLAQLQATLTSAAVRLPARVGVVVEDLPTGYTSSVHPNAVMPAASTIKIPVMVEVFAQIAAGKFDLNRPVQLTASDRDWGSGTLAGSPTGAAFPVSQLLTQMITVSDNTAANMLIRLVGRANINAKMTDLGLNHTALADYIHTAEWSVRTSLRTTPADMVRLLSDMANHQLIDEWSSREMIAILEQQQINTLLPEPLPAIPIAHKTGSFDDTLNDVGIVYAASDPYVIAVLTTDLPTLSAGRRFIRSVSRAAYIHLQQFARLRSDDGDAPQSDSLQTAPNAGDQTPIWSTPAPDLPAPTASP